MNRRRRASALLAVLLGSAFVGASPTPSLGHCMVPGEQKTIEVEVKVLTKRVKRGQVAKFEVRTYRPARENFANSGANLPPGVVPMQPAGGVRLTVGVLTANETIAQNLAEQTNDEGKRLVKMKLGSYHRPGAADLRVKAFLDHFSEQPANTCVELQEGGFAEIDKAFIVR